MSMLLGRLDSDRRETALKIEEENKEGLGRGRSYAQESVVEFDQYRYSETQDQEVSALQKLNKELKAKISTLENDVLQLENYKKKTAQEVEQKDHLAK